jgi:hypothetical protein
VVGRQLKLSPGGRPLGSRRSWKDWKQFTDGLDAAGVLMAKRDRPGGDVPRAVGDMQIAVTDTDRRVPATTLRPGSAVRRGIVDIDRLDRQRFVQSAEYRGVDFCAVGLLLSCRAIARGRPARKATAATWLAALTNRDRSAMKLRRWHQRRIAPLRR